MGRVGAAVLEGWTQGERWVLPDGWCSEADSQGVFTPMFELANLVATEGACALPGVNIIYDNFLSSMWRAVSRDFVRRDHAELVSTWLRWGTDAGLKRSALHGQRVFKNYASAEGDYTDKVQKATQKRVDERKTMDLGAWQEPWRQVMRSVFEHYFVFPLGARPKPLEPDSARPIDDHRRTGLNAATSMAALKHSVTSYADVAAFLKTGYVMHVSDVDSAFPMLPFAPWVWPFLFHRFESSSDRELHLYGHVNGDFGTKGFPGVFKIFFVDVLVQMARCEGILTLPMSIHVDDTGLIGSQMKKVTSEMRRFQQWAEGQHGFRFKWLKDKAAAPVQYMIGFWWDSFERTRTLEESRLAAYMAQLLEFASRKALSLLERQQMAGRMQRAVMTLPPGAACLLTNTFAMMAGLKFGWHQKRTTRAERSDYKFFHDVLQLNLGCGFFSFEHFKEAPEVRSDAARGEYAGGGWASRCGRYDWWQYGTAAASKLIDFLEGDTVVHCLERMGPFWHRKWVPFGIDNSAFEGAARRGRSSADRLNTLLKRLFVRQVQYQCILRPFWLGTKENFLADHLSRGRVAAFLALVYAVGYWCKSTSGSPFSDGGRTRRLDASPPLRLAFLQEHAREPRDMVLYAKQVAAVVPIQAVAKGWLARRALARTAAAAAAAAVAAARPSEKGKPRLPARGGGGSLRLLTLFSMLAVAHGGGEHNYRASSNMVGTYSRSDLYHGATAALAARVEEVLGNRLAESSQRTVRRAGDIWLEVAEANGWEEVIYTDDADRGMKLCAFVLHMMEDTNLVYASIQNYVWGLAVHFQSKRQADPRLDVEHWPDFMASVKVLTWEPQEPRREIPLSLLMKMAKAADQSSFREVQFVFISIVLYFTFSRSECPCPKSFSGKESFDVNKHWLVRDFVWVKVANGLFALKVRFKAIKQDPRIERPTARGDGSEEGASKKGGADWSYVGDAPQSFLSPLKWWKLLVKFYGGRARGATDPMFMDMTQARPYTYTCMGADLQMMLKRVQPEDTRYGITGYRVGGYNLSKSTNGTDLTVAHGLWTSKAHNRYERFKQVSVCGITANMLDEENPYAAAAAEAVAPRGQVTRRPTEAPQAEAAGDDTEEETPEAQEEGQEEAEGEEADNGETPAVPSARQTRRRAVSPASRTPASPRLQPPPGWKVASSKGTKLVVPPTTMVGLEAQATVTSAWRVHREYVKLHGEHDTAPVPRASTRGGTSAAASSH